MNQNHFRNALNWWCCGARCRFAEEPSPLFLFWEGPRQTREREERARSKDECHHGGGFDSADGAKQERWHRLWSAWQGYREATRCGLGGNVLNSVKERKIALCLLQKASCARFFAIAVWASRNSSCEHASIFFLTRSESGNLSSDNRIATTALHPGVGNFVFVQTNKCMELCAARVATSVCVWVAKFGGSTGDSWSRERSWMWRSKHCWIWRSRRVLQLILLGLERWSSPSCSCVMKHTPGRPS